MKKNTDTKETTSDVISGTPTTETPAEVIAETNPIQSEDNSTQKILKVSNFTLINWNISQNQLQTYLNNESIYSYPEYFGLLCQHRNRRCLTTRTNTLMK